MSLLSRLIRAIPIERIQEDGYLYYTDLQLAVSIWSLTCYYQFYSTVIEKMRPVICIAIEAMLKMSLLLNSLLK